MADKKSGALTAQMFGARLGTNAEIRMRYTPAHMNSQGKKVNARLSAPFILNLRGKEGGVRYDIIVWGKLADILAKNWNEGKEMHFPAIEHNPYKGTTYYQGGEIVYEKDGQSLLTWKHSWILREFIWGNESQRCLEREINGEGCSDGSGRRPLNWNNSQHPDNAAWKAILDIRSNTFFSPQHMAGGVFGFADVVMPRGGGTILFGAQYERDAIAYQGIQNVIADPNYNPNRVRHITPVATGAPAAAAPVYHPAPGAPGAAHVAQPHVPLTHQVHTALHVPVASNCAYCQAPISVGMAFCGGCGQPVVAAAAPAPGMPAGMPVPPIPVAGLPVAGAPQPFLG